MAGLFGKSSDSKTILSLLVICWLFLGAVQVPDSYSQTERTTSTTTTSHNNPISSPCKCVVFRMDDVQDNWIEAAQLVGMNLFTSRNQSLTIGLIMNETGGDPRIIHTIQGGTSKGLFELALHGWDHVDYTKLSEQQQQYSLKRANEKMQQLFGNTSNIFITPYGTFNNDTIKAMDQLGIKILSAATYSESSFDKNSSIFNANNNYKSNQSQQSTVYHMPAMSFFKDDLHGKMPIKTPVEKILSDVDSNIKKYGYSVIVFHPQDFVKTDQHGNVVNKTLDIGQVKDLSRLVDSILSKHIQITSFSKLLRDAAVTDGMHTRKVAYLDNSEPQQWLNHESNTKIEFAYSPAVPMVGNFTELKFSAEDLKTGTHLKNVTARVTVLDDNSNNNNATSSFDSSNKSGANISFTNISSYDGNFSVKHKFLNGGMFQVILRVNSGNYGIALASFSVYVI
jgi:peptidoglycan/xylan/chitin deacetylase (PgdA/CDA1 family)